MATKVPVKFKYGRREEYLRVVDAGTVDADALYFITDTGEIYHGARNLARGNYHEGIRAEGESDNDVIARVIEENEVLVVKDDIFVVKTPITEDKTSYTSYVYDGANWCAMDGNYNAENVYFDDDLTFTKEIGYVTLNNGSAVVEAKGKNIKQLFEALFSKETDPTVTQPSASISVDKFGEYEVGTNVTGITYSAAFNPGTYEYGPATSVSAVTYTVTCNGETKNAASGSFADIQVTDSTNIQATVKVDHTAGVTPLTNLGNESQTANIAIAAGSKSANSGTLKGYRKMFWGTMATKELTSDAIRALANSKKPANGALSTLTAGEGVACVVVAIPVTSGKKVTKVTMPSSLNADATADFVLQENKLSVEGANHYDGVDYNVYMYAPAQVTAGASFAITIG